MTITVTTRRNKGSKLLHEEMDDNLDNIATALNSNITAVENLNLNNVFSNITENIITSQIYALKGGLIDVSGIINTAINTYTVGSLNSQEPVIIIPPGAYRISSTIYLKDRVTIRGSGMGSTRLIVDSGITAIMADTLVSAIDIGRAGITDLIIQFVDETVTSVNSNGIHLKSSSFGRIWKFFCHNVQIYGAGNHGIYLEGITEAIEECDFRNIEIAKHKKCGIYENSKTYNQYCSHILVDGSSSLVGGIDYMYGAEYGYRTDGGSGIYNHVHCVACGTNDGLGALSGGSFRITSNNNQFFGCHSDRPKGHGFVIGYIPNQQISCNDFHGCLAFNSGISYNNLVSGVVAGSSWKISGVAGLHIIGGMTGLIGASAGGEYDRFNYRGFWLEGTSIENLVISNQYINGTLTGIYTNPEVRTGCINIRDTIFKNVASVSNSISKFEYTGLTINPVLTSSTITGNVINLTPIISIQTQMPLFLSISSNSVYPENVKYVSTNDTNSVDLVSAGSSLVPFKTLSFAMTQLNSGDTLMIKEGVYREPIILSSLKTWSSLTPTRIVGDGNVQLLGSTVVTGWIPESGNKYKVAWSGEEPQQVILNGVKLQQIAGTVFGGYPTNGSYAVENPWVTGSIVGDRATGRIVGDRATMPLESFFYDSVAQELVICTVNTIVNVEVSTIRYLFIATNANGVTLENIKFRYSNASTIGRFGTITMYGGNDNTLKNLVVEDSDSLGILLHGNNNVIQGCTVTRAGRLAINARGTNVLVTGCVASYSNYRGFNKYWETGGMKFTGNGGLLDSFVTNNTVNNNYGDGIWFDWGNNNNVINGNTIAYNTGFGFHYEASTEGYFVDNKVFANGQNAVYLSHSRNCVVAHNLVSTNGGAANAIIALDENRANEGSLDFRTRNNVVFANVIAYGNSGQYDVVLTDDAQSKSNGNLFIKANSPIFGIDTQLANAAYYTFVNWKASVLNDIASVNHIASIPTQLATDFSNYNLNPDFSSLNSFIAGYTVPASTLQLQLPNQTIILTTRAGAR